MSIIRTTSTITVFVVIVITVTQAAAQLSGMYAVVNSRWLLKVSAA